MMKESLFLTVLWLLCAGIEAQNKSGKWLQQSSPEVQRNRRPPFKSWNSQMYPVWEGSEDQKRDCWKGGEVTLNLQNDAPTLTGAKATFFIQLKFPHNQTVLPDGQVVWSQNITNNGTWVSSGDPVYPDESAEGSKCTFPDGRPFPEEGPRRSKFVYVWQLWGKYWQVVDGPSSNLTVETDGVPLGSYTMNVVVYHYRGRQKFIPIGSTSSQFAITDQIPISVSMSQVLDLDQNDQRFIQNRAVSFSVTVHDPSNYLQAADVSFSWDFGDQSGILITHNTGVTHTYLFPGVFNAKVTVQAAIPISPCGTTVQVATTDLSPEFTTETAAGTTNGGQEPVTPTGTTLPEPGNTTLSADAAVDLSVTVVLDEVNMESASVVPETVPTVASEVVTVVSDEVVAIQTEAIPTEDGASITTEETQNEVDVEQTEALPSLEAVPSQAGETVTQPSEASEEGTAQSTDTVEVSPSQSPAEGLVAENETMLATEAVPATENEEILIIAKRQAPEGSLVGCVLYRYGTIANDLEIVSGIESVQIVQVEPIVATGLENAVDLTITCQGSVPSQVCTVVSDADCENPQETVCNPVAPSSDCQLVLRQAFNDSGVFCVNVSLADGVSLAVASAQVSVSAGAVSSVNGIGITVGVLLTAFVVATVAYTYRRTKSYSHLGTEHPSVNWFPDRPSLRLFIQNFLGRSFSGENSPLLNGRVV